MKNDDYGFYGKGLDSYVHYRQGMQEAQRNAPSSAGRNPASVPSRRTERQKAPNPLTWRRWSRTFHITAVVLWCLALVSCAIKDCPSTTGTLLIVTTLFYCLGIIYLLVEGIYFYIWFASYHS